MTNNLDFEFVIDYHKIMIVDILKEKYQPSLDKIDYKKINNGNLNPDVYLFQKWHEKIAPKWYGFSLSNDVPFIWATIIDEFLIWLEKECPNFEIHQIKLKWGGLRFYVSVENVTKKQFTNIHDEISKLEDWLQNPALVY